METVAPPESASSDTNPEIDLLLARDPASDWRRWRVAGIVSLAVHIVLLTALLLMPESATELRIYQQRPDHPGHSPLHADRPHPEGSK